MDLSPIKGPFHVLLIPNTFLSVHSFVFLSLLLPTLRFELSSYSIPTNCLPCGFFALSAPASVPSAPALTIIVMIVIIQSVLVEICHTALQISDNFERYKI